MPRLHSLIPAVRTASVRLFCDAAKPSPGEQKIVEILRRRFPTANSIGANDISGGCGSMFQVLVETDEFRGIMKVKQHKMVTESLRKEIADMHGIVIETKVPKKQ